MLWLFVALAWARTEVFLFTDQRYANMTLAVARDIYRLAHHDVENPALLFLVTIWVLDETECSFFVPFFCVSPFVTASDYWSRIEKRMTVLAAALEHPHTGVDGILMLDSDVLLRRNIVDRMVTYGTDFVVQRELPCSSVNCANAGVWWARTSVPALRVVQHTLRLMASLALPDQDALNIALSTQQASVTYLPVDRYPNGFVYEANNRLEASRVHLVHVNWCPFDFKQARLDDARKPGRWLATPTDSNQTTFCASLALLDLHNLAAILGCTRAESRMRLRMRCP